MKSFNGSIEQLLWPERREGNRKYMTASGKEVPGVVDVTTERSYLRVPKGYLPDFLQQFVGPLSSAQPWLFKEDGIQVGPIPQGTPVNLLSNIDLEQKIKVAAFVVKAKEALKSVQGASDEEIRRAFSGLVQPLLELSKCPDFVVNRGHYFGTDYFAEEPGLSDQDKSALIEFLKTI